MSSSSLSNQDTRSAQRTQRVAHNGFEILQLALGHHLYELEMSKSINPSESIDAAEDIDCHVLVVNVCSCMSQNLSRLSPSYINLLLKKETKYTRTLTI